MKKGRSYIQETLSAYDESAEHLGLRYSQADPDKMFSSFKKQFPTLNALAVMDGIGRDSEWLAQCGFQVDAFDGSNELLVQAEKYGYQHPNVHRYQDIAPDMPVTSAAKKKYDVILMSACIFFLDQEDRYKLMTNIRDFSKPGTVIYLNLRHGPPSPGQGKFFNVNSEEIIRYSQRELLHLQTESTKKDSLGRSDIWWENYILKVPETHEAGLNIFRKDIIQANKFSTYKIALAYIITEISNNAPEFLQRIDDAYISIPLGIITQEWIKIYHSLSSFQLPQMKGNYSDDYKVTAPFSHDVLAEDFEEFYSSGSLVNTHDAEALIKILRYAKKKIIEQPVEYTRRNNNKRRKIYNYVSPQTYPLKIKSAEDLNRAFGYLCIRDDMIEAAQNHHGLISAGIVQEWGEFCTQLGQDRDSDLTVKKALGLTM